MRNGKSQVTPVGCRAQTVAFVQNMQNNLTLIMRVWQSKHANYEHASKFIMQLKAQDP